MTETQAITIRLPQDVYEHLRREAFEARTSQTAIMVEALEEKLGLRPEGLRHLPRMPVSKEEFDMAMNVFMRVLEVIRPDETPAETSAAEEKAG